jgi:hypothetical protein
MGGVTRRVVALDTRVGPRNHRDAPALPRTGATVLHLGPTRRSFASPTRSSVPEAPIGRGFRTDRDIMTHLDVSRKRGGSVPDRSASQSRRNAMRTEGWNHCSTSS